MALLDKDLDKNFNFPFCHFDQTINQLVNTILVLLTLP